MDFQNVKMMPIKKSNFSMTFKNLKITKRSLNNIGVLFQKILPSTDVSVHEFQSCAEYVFQESARKHFFEKN